MFRSIEMKQILKSALVALSTALCCAASPAKAQSSRTYVSGTGKDGNPCTAASPCKTLQTAINLTAAGGEVYVLNSANYGSATINKSLTITSEGNATGLLATSGAAITISAGATDVISLRGLDIDGGGIASVGVQFTSGQSLNIQKTSVRNFANSGIVFNGTANDTLFISDTVAANNVNNGILVQAGSGPVNGAFNRITASGNGAGILIAGTGVAVAMTDSVLDSNNYGIGAGSSAVLVRNSTVAHNAVGISADQSSTVSVVQSTVTGNGTGWQAINFGQLATYGNNNVAGNANDGTPTTTIPLE
jgi:hypothetical protein